MGFVDDVTEVKKEGRALSQCVIRISESLKIERIHFF